MIQFKNDQVTVFESALYRTTASVLETPDLVLVVDPNWLPAEVAAIRRHVAEIRKERPVFLFFTHSDYDHILGFGAFPGTRVIASQALAVNPDQSAILEQIRQFDDEYYIERDYPVIYPNVDLEVDADGWSFSEGSTRLTAWTAPGHNRDGLFLLIQPGSIFITGDYLCNVEFPFIYHSSTDYLASLAKAEHIIDTHQPRLLVPGHGDAMEDIEEMRKRLDEALKYVRDLRACVQAGEYFPEEELLCRYNFPKGLRKEHRKNVELVRKELLG